MVIDYHLTGPMTGEDLAHDIRSCRPAVRLIMLTGDPRIPDSARASVDAVLIKGMNNPADLLATIQDLLPEATLKRPHGHNDTPTYKAS